MGLSSWMPGRDAWLAMRCAITRAKQSADSAYKWWEDGVQAKPDARSRREEHGLESPQYMFFCPVTFLAFDSKITKVRFDKIGKGLS